MGSRHFVTFRGAMLRAAWIKRGRRRRTNARDPSLPGEIEGNKMSTVNMVLLLLAVVLSVFVGFAWMAYCFR